MFSKLLLLFTLLVLPQSVTESDAAVPPSTHQAAAASGFICCGDASQATCEGASECTWDDKETQCLSACPGMSQAQCNAAPYCVFLGGEDDWCAPVNADQCTPDGK